MNFKELQESQRELNSLKHDLKWEIRKWLYDENYKSVEVNVDNDKIRVKTYGKQLRGIDLSLIQHEFKMSLTLTQEIKRKNINEDSPLYGVKGDEYHIWEYWFR